MTCPCSDPRAGSVHCGEHPPARLALKYPEAELTDAGITAGLDYAVGFLVGSSHALDMAGFEGFARLMRNAAGELLTVPPARVREDRQQ